MTGNNGKISKSTLLIAGIIILAVLFIAGGLTLYQYLMPKYLQPVEPTPSEIPNSSPVPTPIPTSQPNSEVLEDTGIPNQKRYTSTKLGLSFVFMAVQQGDYPAFVKEVDNKIYVYVSPNKEEGDYQNGQYVEVFPKDKGKTLEQAMQEKFLIGSYADYCVVDNNLVPTQPTYPPTFVLANIHVRNYRDIKDMVVLNEKLKNCPSPYTQSNGISYFLADTDHYDKFLFFSIGQYGIMADGSGTLGWQDTIKFL